MYRPRIKDRFSIAGMLFIVLGFSLFWAIIPYLEGASRISPSWAVCVAIVLMLAWAIIPLRQGARRAWWLVFFVFGCVYLAIALAVVPLIVSGLLVGIDEVYGAFGVLVVTLAVLPAWCVIGGHLFVAWRGRIHSRYAKANSE